MRTRLKVFSSFLTAIMLISLFSGTVFAANPMVASGSTDYYDWEYYENNKLYITAYDRKYIDIDLYDIDEQYLELADTVEVDIGNYSHVEGVDIYGNYCNANKLIISGGSDYFVNEMFIENFPNIDEADDITFPLGIQVNYMQFYSMGFTDIPYFENLGSVDMVLESCGSIESVDVPGYILGLPWCYYLTDATIEYGREIINSNMFRYCESLNNVVIPSTVTSIEYGAFMGCGSLRSLSLPDSVNSIAPKAFMDSGLETFEIPEDVGVIPFHAFAYCNDLESVYIPVGVSIIEVHSFLGCESLTDVYYGGTRSQYENIFVYSADDNDSDVEFTVQDLFDENVRIHFSDEPELTIVSDPEDFYGLAGKKATFSVEAEGEGLTYQWQMYKDGEWKNSSASGSKTNKITFNITSAHDGMEYRCVVTDSYGKKEISQPATLTVISTELAITKQPDNFTGPAGSQANFSIAAQGDGLTYQWQMYTDGAWKNSSATGAKTNKITFNITSAHNGMKYRCIVKDKYGNSVTSDAATLTVGTKLAITKQPDNFIGSVGSTASFSVTAQGDGLTYQWQMYTDGAWKNSSAGGAKTNKITFNITNAHNGMKYRCIVKDKYGNSVTSNAATLTVGTKLAITKQPANFIGSVGSTASFSVTAQGDGLTYQWQMYTGGTWKNSSATGAKTNKITFNITSAHNGMKYRCIVKDKYGNSVTSNAATLTVGTKLAITKQPANFTGLVGTQASFSVTAQGDGLTYQWQMYTGGTWKNSSATGAKTNKITFNITSAHNGMKYRCIVKDKYGNSVTSNAATLTVGNKLAITKQPVNFTGEAGTQASFSVTAQGDGLTYQWQMYTGGVWKNSSATGAKTNKITFNITDAHDGMKYRCVVKDKYGNQVISNVVTVKVVVYELVV